VRHDFSPPILQAAPKLKFVSFILGLRLEMLLLTILDWTVSGPFWTGLDAKEEGVTRAGGGATEHLPHLDSCIGQWRCLPSGRRYSEDSSGHLRQQMISRSICKHRARSKQNWNKVSEILCPVVVKSDIQECDT
jgi:hypothetical protein